MSSIWHFYSQSEYFQIFIIRFVYPLIFSRALSLDDGKGTSALGPNQAAVRSAAMFDTSNTKNTPLGIPLIRQNILCVF